MKQGLFEVRSNRPLTPWVWEMVLAGDCSAVERPGQFVNVQVPGFYLRRPLSVCDCDRAQGLLTLVYKVVGEGTEAMTALAPGSMLDALTGLGNGYDLQVCSARPVLVGGGVGVPPLYWTAKQLVAAGRDVNVVLAFNTAAEVFYEEEFRELGVHVQVVTVDGSKGAKGFATDVLPTIDCTYLYTCGPLPMMRALYRSVPVDGQFSLEERMGCGFGACMGCTIKTKAGHRRVCKEGPVFKKEELEWDV